METDCGKAGVTKGAARQGATAVGLVGDAADLDQEDGHSWTQAILCPEPRGQ